MSPTKTREVQRITLWSKIYAAVTVARIAGAASYTQSPEYVADAALAEFDKRFPPEQAQKQNKETKD